MVDMMIDMMSANAERDAVGQLLDELIAQQEAKVLTLGRTLVPGLTPEDLRNPHDFSALVAGAQFNYEDGVLAGLRTAQIAIRAQQRRDLRCESGDPGVYRIGGARIGAS
jgi:hypothetical protein